MQPPARIESVTVKIPVPALVQFTVILLVPIPLVILPPTIDDI